MKVFNVFPSRPGEPALVSAAAMDGAGGLSTPGRETGGAAAGPGPQRCPPPGARVPLGPAELSAAPGADLREDVVDADDAVRAGGAAVVHDGGVALHPHPAAVLGQEAVVFGGHLPFHQHCGDKAGRASERLPTPFDRPWKGGAPPPPSRPPWARKGTGNPLASHREAAWTETPVGKGAGDPRAGLVSVPVKDYSGRLMGQGEYTGRGAVESPHPPPHRHIVIEI